MQSDQLILFCLEFISALAQKVSCPRQTFSLGQAGLFLKTALLKYIPHTIKFTCFKVYELVALSAFTRLGNYLLYLIPEYFQHPPKKPCTH